MKIDEVFHSPEEMADSLLRNWRWQWFYKNRKLLGCQDFENICNLDNNPRLASGRIQTKYTNPSE